MQITIEKLIEINACNEARAWFRDAFPSGSTPISPEVLAKCDRDDWLCRLACKLSESYRLWRTTAGASCQLAI